MNLEDSLLNDNLKQKLAEKQEAKSRKIQGLSSLASPLITNEAENASVEPSSSGKSKEKSAKNSGEPASPSTPASTSGVSAAAHAENEEKLKRQIEKNNELMKRIKALEK